MSIYMHFLLNFFNSKLVLIYISVCTCMSAYFCIIIYNYYDFIFMSAVCMSVFMGELVNACVSLCTYESIFSVCACVHTCLFVYV